MPSNSARSRHMPLHDEVATRRIAIIVFPGVTLLDISGPAQVFAELKEMLLGEDSALDQKRREFLDYLLEQTKSWIAQSGPAN